MVKRVGNQATVTPRKLASRTVLAAVNEGVKAAWMLTLTIWIARNVSVVDFGGYTISATIYVIAVGLNQGATVMTYMVLTGRGEPHRAGHPLGASLLLSAISMFGFGVLSLCTLGSSVASTSVAFLLVTPPLMLQHTAVGLLYARRKVGAALVCTCVWVGVGCLLLWLAPPAIGRESAAWAYVMAWGVAATVSGIAGCALLREAPLARGVWYWLRSNRSVILDLTGADGLARASGQSTTWVLGLVGGLPITAGLRASQIPLGVPRVLLTGLSPLMLSEGTRVARAGARPLRRLVRAWTLVVGALVTGIGILAYLVPDAWGRAIAGESWEYAVPILPFATLIALANSATVPALTGLNSLGDTRAGLRVRAWTAVLPALGTLVGGLVSGPTAAVQGAAAGMMLTALVTTTVFERVCRRDNNPIATDTRALQ